MVTRHSRHRVRTGIAAAFAVAALVVTFAAPAAADPVPTLNRVDAASGWLARQMVDGERFEVVFGDQVFPDQGLTIDAVFSFAAAKSADAFAARATAWLARPEILTGYIGDGVEAYAGATAKLSLEAQVRGLDPRSFGGIDLLVRLRGLQTPSGRFSDRSVFGDFSNAFSQSFAVLTLHRAGGAPAAAVSFLAAQQCADGGFPLLFDQPTCVSDVDATAMAVQALLAAGRHAVAAAGARWLASVQGADGSFAAEGVPNANSTGLAAQALRVTGRLLDWLQARQFLLSLQVRCDGAPANRGAIAFTTDGFDPATAARATAQAIPGLAGAGFGTLSAAGSHAADAVLACPA